MVMTSAIELLGPVIALVAWSMIMWIWMYATRLPAVFAAKMKLDPNAPSGEQMSLLPPKVRWKAENYNHLMEQPTVFYALAISLALLGVNSDTVVFVAWSYVALRVVHSLVHALVNIIALRFGVFVLSNIPLFVLTYFAADAFLLAATAS